MKKATIGILTLGLALIQHPALAQGIDGAEPLICAAINTTQCEAGAACLEGDAEALNIPSFVRISLADKRIRGTRPNGESLDTVIGSSTRDQGELLLQGVENGRGWSMAITEATGRMVLSASGDEIAFVVFGACTGLNGKGK